MEQVRRLPGGGLGVGAVGLGGLGQRGQLVVRSGQGLGRPDDAAAGGHRALDVAPVLGREERGSRRSGAAGVGSEQLAGGEPRGDVVGDAVGEDQALEQRVGGQPVGAVDAGARGLAARVQAVEGGPAVEVDLDAAAGVVLRGGDRDEVGGEVEAVLAEAATIDGNRRSTNSRPR